MFGWIFTNILAVVGALYGWSNPLVGLYIYWTFGILRPTFLWFWAFGGNTTRHSLIVALSALVGWALKGMGDWRGVRAVMLPLMGLGVYLFSGTIGTIAIALDRARAWDYLYPQLTIALMMLVSLSMIRTEKHLHIFAWVVTGCLGYLAYVFNSQYFFDGYNRIWLRGFGGIDNNGVAMIMDMGVPLSFFMAIHCRQWWAKGLCAFAALLEMHVVLFSFSRGGQLGLCMVGAAVFIIALTSLPNKVLTLLVAALFVGAGLDLAGKEVRARFMTIFADPEQRDASAASRFDTWNGAILCMQDHPLGVGPRQFNLISQNYGLAHNKSVHNLFLQTGADYGIQGMLGLIAFYFGTLWQTFWMTFTPTAKRLVWPRYFGQMVCLSLGGFIVCSQFIGMESVETAYIVGLLGLCTVVYVRRLAEVESHARVGVVPELEEVHDTDEEGGIVPA